MKIFKNTKIPNKNIIKHVKEGEVVLCLSRHGESEANVDFSVYKHTKNSDIKLTDKGKKQIEAAAYQICKLFHQFLPYPWDTEKFRIYSSTYARAQESASIMAYALLQDKLFGREKAIKIGSITKTDLLTERMFGMAEGVPSIEHFVENTIGEQEIWNSMGEYLYAPPRGESLRDVYIRCGLFLQHERWFEDNKFNLVCSHKSTCMEMERYLIGTAPNDWNNAESKIYIIQPHKQQATIWGIIREESLD